MALAVMVFLILAELMHWKTDCRVTSAILVFKKTIIGQAPMEGSTLWTKLRFVFGTLVLC